MPRKPIGLKFEEDDVARWDAWAIEQGLTRTRLIETAVEHLIAFEDALQAMAAGDMVMQIPSARTPLPVGVGAQGRAVGARNAALQARGLPVLHQRRAYICLHQDNNKPPCNRRLFLTPDEPDRTPDCPEHGPMTHQANRPYKGVPVG